MTIPLLTLENSFIKAVNLTTHGVSSTVQSKGKKNMDLMEVNVCSLFDQWMHPNEGGW